MSERKIINPTNLDKNLRVISEVIMCKHRGKYFHPIAVVEKCELSDELHAYVMETSSWMKVGLHYGYFQKADDGYELGYELGANGKRAYDNGGIAQFLQKQIDLEWEKGREKREQDELRRLDLIIKTDQVRYLWLDRILGFIPFFKK